MEAAAAREATIMPTQRNDPSIVLPEPENAASAAAKTYVMMDTSPQEQFGKALRAISVVVKQLVRCERGGMVVLVLAENSLLFG